MTKGRPDLDRERPVPPWLGMPGIVLAVLGFLCPGAVVAIVWCFLTPGTPDCLGLLIRGLFYAIRPIAVGTLAISIRIEAWATLGWNWFGLGVAACVLTAAVHAAFHPWVLTPLILER